MASKSVKSLGFVGFMAGVSVLAMTSAAFACTTSAGEVVLKGINGTTVNGTLGGSATYRGNGSDFVNAARNYGYCGGLPTSRTAVDTGAGPQDFRLTVAPYTCSTQYSADTKVPAGTWEVRWVKAETAIDTTWPHPVCHNDVDSDTTTTNNPTSRWVVLGTLTIDASGNGAGDFPLPATMFGPGNICVERSPVSGGSPNIGPPTIFMNKTNLI